MILLLALLACHPDPPEPAPTNPCAADDPPASCFDPEPQTYAVAADTCATCHPAQAEEWRGSIMHYAAVSPVFNAFELAARELTQGKVAADGASPNFCIRCHAPMGDYNSELLGFADERSHSVAVDQLSEVAAEGLSCVFCHSVQGSTDGLLGDGIANTALSYAPDLAVRGPIEDPAQSAYHFSTTGDEFFTDPAFCGACHDVRPMSADWVTGETSTTGAPFQRLENLFTEWQTGPYNTPDNPQGQIVTCQDCHMSLYPAADPGCYPTGAVAESRFGDASVALGPTDRRHAIHAFTAVSVPLFTEDDPRFPNTDTDASTRYLASDDPVCGASAGQTVAYPLGQQQRREAMLGAAATLTFREESATTVSGDTLHLELLVSNTGVGHNLPSGFSQERQVWIELIVRDDAGILYQSGVLEDRAHPETGELVADGLLDDEDLDGIRFEFADEDAIRDFLPEPVEGEDADQRPDGVNLGLVSFQNRFIVCDDGDCAGFLACLDAVCEPERRATWHQTLNPFIANHMDNSRSIPPLQSRAAIYDVPLPAGGVTGDVIVSARLRYRAFPPEFIRFLAVRDALMGRESAVSEGTVDRNTIVDLASAELQIPSG